MMFSFIFSIFVVPFLFLAVVDVLVDVVLVVVVLVDVIVLVDAVVYIVVVHIIVALMSPNFVHGLCFSILRQHFWLSSRRNITSKFNIFKHKHDAGE